MTGVKGPGTCRVGMWAAWEGVAAWVAWSGRASGEDNTCTWGGGVRCLRREWLVGEPGSQAGITARKGRVGLKSRRHLAHCPCDINPAWDDFEGQKSQWC